MQVDSIVVNLPNSRETEYLTANDRQGNIEWQNPHDPTACAMELAVRHPDYTSMVIVVMPDVPAEITQVAQLALEAEESFSSAAKHSGLTHEEIGQITGGDDGSHAVDYRHATD